MRDTHQINFDAGQAVIVSLGERLEFKSRLFVENKWLDVPFRAGGVPEEPLLEVVWRTETAPVGVLLSATLRNSGEKPLVLGAFHMLENSGGAQGTTRDDAILVDSGGGWFAGAVRVTASSPQYMEYWKNYYLADEDINWAVGRHGDLKQGAHYSVGGMITYQRRRKGLPAWLFSFVVPMRRCAATPILLAAADGSIESMALSNNFAGYQLDPGEEFETEEILAAAFDSPHAAIETWASFCADRRRVELWPKTPPVGWLSWYGYRLTQNEADTIRTADLIKNKLDGLDFKYIQLDLGYNKGNLPGDWFETNEHFPSGLPNLAEKLSARGFRLGVWACPFTVAADSQFAKEHPEALLPCHPDEKGKWFWEPHCDLLQLDPTHPEGENFLRRMVSYFKSAGVTYFKFDFTGRTGRVDKNLKPFNRKTVKGVELYRHGLETLMSMMDRDDYVYWCSNLLHFGLGIGATSMAACDIGNTGFARAKKIEGRVEGIDYFRAQATTTMSRYYMHRRLLLLNPDALNLAPPADMEERRMRATLVAMSGGQMFLGDRFDLAEEEDCFTLIRQCAPPYGEAARPVDLFRNVYPESYPRIWHLRVDTGWDERDIVAFVNCGCDTENYSLSMSDLRLPACRTYHIWEFWEKRSLGTHKDSFRIEVPSGSARLAALVPERKHPWALSTSFHVSHGAVGMSDVKWCEESQTLSGILSRPDGMRGEIYIAVPENYLCDLQEAAPKIYSLPLTGNGGNLHWQAQFRHSGRNSKKECERLSPEKPEPPFTKFNG